MLRVSRDDLSRTATLAAREPRGRAAAGPRRGLIAGVVLATLLLAQALPTDLATRASSASVPGPGARDTPARYHRPPAPAPIPAARLASAIAVARAAPMRVSFALMLPDGTVVGHGLDVRYRSASLSKSLLAVTLLSSPHARDPVAREDARRMVEQSDNGAATRVLARVGQDAVRAEARRAHMYDFRIASTWADAVVTARDFATLFARAPGLLPARERATWRSWFRHVLPDQSWGIPQALRPRGAQVMFKGGWRAGIVHQAARVEVGGQVYGLAVLTDHDAGMRPGVAAVEQIAGTLLGTTDETLCCESD